MRFPKISANQICMSPDLFLAKMDIERFGETSFPKTTDMSGGWNLSLPFKSPMIWGIWSFDKISVLSVCFDPYRYMPSPFGCHACTRNGLHEAIVPRTWIPARRSWPHRIHRQNYGIRTESLHQTGRVLAGILLSLLLQRRTTGSRSGWLRLELVVSLVRHRAPCNFIVNKNDLPSHYLVFEESHRFRQAFLLCERLVVGVCLHHLDVSICTSCMRVC